MICTLHKNHDSAKNRFSDAPLDTRLVEIDVCGRLFGFCSRNHRIAST